MSRYALSFQLFSARNFPPLSAQLKKLKALGYDAVEPFMPNFDDGADEFRKMIDGEGLKCLSFHANYRDMIADPQKYVDLAQTIGATYIMGPWLEPADRGRTADAWAEIGDNLTRTIDAAKKAGVQVGWHNHDFEFEALDDGSLPMTHLLNAAGDDLVMELDIAWVTRAGLSPATILNQFKDRVVSVHIKDTAPKGTTHEDGWTVPGKGILNWAEAVPAIAETKAELLVVEHDNPSDWEALATDAIAFARKTFG